MAWLPCRGRRLIAGNGSLAVEVGFGTPLSRIRPGSYGCRHVRTCPAQGGDVSMTVRVSPNPSG